MLKENIYTFFFTKLTFLHYNNEHILNSVCRAPKPAWLSTTICNARCYWTHRGFDYGYYENGQCKCAPPTVYVFNGMGHDLSDEYIETSLDNDNIIENPVKINYTYIIIDVLLPKRFFKL